MWVGIRQNDKKKMESKLDEAKQQAVAQQRVKTYIIYKNSKYGFTT